MIHTDKPSRPCGSSGVDIRDYFTLWITKLEEFYDERDLANKESVKSAFDAAEKLGEKTEVALSEYKAGANEWRDTVKDLIAGLKESRAITENQDARFRGTQSWLIPVMVLAGIAVLNLILNIISYIHK